jgi:hypothetical protein
MKYTYTIGYALHVEKTLDFYAIAFEFAKKFITPEKGYGELVSGETTFAFASIPLENCN